MQVIWVILILAVSQSKGDDSPVREMFHELLTAINCLDSVNTPATCDSVMTAFEACASKGDIDQMCLYPCIKIELGLVKGDELMVDEISKFMDKQFVIDAKTKAGWIEGIQKCFAQYLASGNHFPTEYTNCHQQEAGLHTLSDCVLASRNCQAVSASKGRSFWNAAKPFAVMAANKGMEKLQKSK